MLHKLFSDDVTDQEVVDATNIWARVFYGWKASQFPAGYKFYGSQDAEEHAAWSEAARFVEAVYAKDALRACDRLDGRKSER